MKITSRNLQFFCYDYFEDLLTSINFAKNFGFLSGIVSKIFAKQTTTIINNYDCQILKLNEIFTVKKLIFFLCMIGKSYLLHYIILTIAHKNLILETTRILQIQCFFPR